MKSKTRKLLILILNLTIPLIVGGFAAALTSGGMAAFEDISKPALTPPAIVFPIVWTVLYLLMGFSAFGVATAKVKRRLRRNSLGIYAFQLALNFLWTIIFFGTGNYLAAFVCLILLWLAVLLNILSFASIRPWTGYLQIPYLLWVTFSGYLNFMIYRMN